MRPPRRHRARHLATFPAESSIRRSRGGAIVTRCPACNRRADKSRRGRTEKCWGIRSRRIFANCWRRCRMKPGREVIEVNLPEWQALLERARQEPLDEEGYEKLQAALRAFRLLTDLIGEKDTTISRLRAVLGKPSTENTSKVLEQAGLEP